MLLIISKGPVRSVFTLSIFFVYQLITFNGYAQFKPGNLVVLQVGAGSAALSSAATAISAIEHTTSGSATGFSVALPTTTVSCIPPITISGLATSEGQLTMSAERDRLIIEGSIHRLVLPALWAYLLQPLPGNCLLFIRRAHMPWRKFFIGLFCK